MERINYGRVKFLERATKKLTPQQQLFATPMSTVSVRPYYVPTRNGISTTRCSAKNYLPQNKRCLEWWKLLALGIAELKSKIQVSATSNFNADDEFTLPEDSVITWLGKATARCVLESRVWC